MPPPTVQSRDAPASPRPTEISSPTVADLTAFERHLETSLKDLEETVRRLHHIWTGAAADAQAAAQKEWAKGATEMHTSLNIMRKAAETGSKNYTTVATHNTDLWS
ncbi:ESAT-6-like protein EsxE [Austwickia sp. TVS 96-490-7B]|uniref:WXG100 family type VII secretion target n=1 Tax=Austwickia sp. TVS 96-490-7B TaxID=2830843 RepID=UPI001C58F5DD|nr:WXG100 family type VII secretion target [Austwickia sp. TVS 96-490-7B]MBW3084351.1 ESAT-6-like protein EsxE [Austwickia sp. TVS 96-490-7B]